MHVERLVVPCGANGVWRFAVVLLRHGDSFMVQRYDIAIAVLEYFARNFHINFSFARPWSLGSSKNDNYMLKEHKSP